MCYVGGKYKANITAIREPTPVINKLCATKDKTMDIKKYNQAYADYLDKQESKAKLNIVLDDLYGIVKTTRQNIYFWRIIYSAVKTRPDLVGLSDLFLINYALLLINACILDMSKLFDEGKCSINLNFFTNLVLNEGKKYLEEKARKSLIAQIKKDKLDFEKLHDLIGRIKKKRDKEIAHSDRKLLGQRNTAGEKVEVDELEKALDEFEKIISNYYSIANYEIPSDFNGYLTAIQKMGVTTDLESLKLLLDIALDKIDSSDANEVIKRAIETRKIQRILDES